MPGYEPYLFLPGSAGTQSFTAASAVASFANRRARGAMALASAEKLAQPPTLPEFRSGVCPHVDFNRCLVSSGHRRDQIRNDGGNLIQGSGLL